MYQSKSKRRVQNAGLAVLSLLPALAAAVEYTGEASVGIGYSDNVARTTVNEESDTIRIFGLAFGLTEDTRRMRANFNARFDYLDFSSDRFENEWVGGMEGFAQFTLVDERLTWDFADSYGQQLGNPLQPAAPGNRRDVNFFTTGPTLRLLPASRNLLNVDVRYSNVIIEDLNFDNDRYSYGLQFGREVRRNQTLSGNVRKEEVNYESSSPGSDFDRYEYFLSYAVIGGQSTLSADIGFSEIESDLQDADGIVARINLTRELTPSSALTFSGGTRYSDQGDVFRFFRGNTANLDDTIDTLAVGQPFINNFFVGSYNLFTEGQEINLSVFFNQEDFEGTNVDRDVMRLQGRVRNYLTTDFFIGFNARYQQRDFKYLGREDDDIVFGAEVGYDVTPRFRALLLARRFQRNSSVIAGDLDENQVFLRFTYTPSWSQ